MDPSPPRVALALAVVALVAAGAAAQSARISEETRVLRTYPFSEPNPIPILTRDARLYPYHSFEGYATEAVERAWKVVRLENDLIEVFVLPEVGGKVWGAVVKKTGHEFIYRNEVMKFRNIALRGPWTSGGIEFNFGVIGHTPATATPVDYVLRENPDGSVSCIVGAMDLPSRTHWRVEIRLEPGRAAFETNVLWYNPTSLEQPYYNWMTAAAFARDDLEMAIPGNAFLEHSGAPRAWPTNAAGRFLPRYAENTFAGHKSYHVVGELNDFFGGYYHDDGYGFGHWSRYEEMPGQKLWLWALSREGGVWEDLLTDTDGQYVEYQAGRLLVQYAPGDDVNPITQAGFEPGAADRWTESWFPVEGLGGLTDASRDGAMHVDRAGRLLTVRVHAFGDAADTVRVWSGGRVAGSFPVTLPALEAVERSVDLPGDGPFRVEVPGLGLDYDSDPAARTLSRPFSTDPAAVERIRPADRLAFEGRELAKARRYREARELFEAVRLEEPLHRVALLGLADLDYRRGLYASGLAAVNEVLRLDAYDAGANFIAGNLYRALGRTADARDAFGWAARSMTHRSAAYVQLAEIALAEGDRDEATRYAGLALDYDRYNLPARQVLAMAARQAGDGALAASVAEELLAIDALHHFVAAEAYLAAPGDGTAAALAGALRGEHPEQVVIELAADYVRRGARGDARAMLALGDGMWANPLFDAWIAWLDDGPSRLRPAADLAFAFPYRRETLAVLAWAAERSDHWSWSYLLALNLAARDRLDEAAALLAAVGDDADHAPLYAARASLLSGTPGYDPEADVRRAVDLDGDSRILRVELVRYLHDSGRWEDALAESAAGRDRFPDDFNLDLLHVRALNHLGRARDAIAILDAIRVLPSENARESHRLYAQAHTIAALDALEANADGDARRHLQAALLWPEHLGQGRPYDPEERLVRYLLGVTARRLGDGEASRAHFEAVVSASGRGAGGRTALDLLAIPALAALDRLDALPSIRNDPRGNADRLAQELIGALRDGRDPAEVAARLDEDRSGLFAGLDGALLRRALAVSP